MPPPPPDSPCPFLELPLELRDQIYSDAFSDTHITYPTVNDHIHSEVPSDTQIAFPTVNDPNALSLLYTCPQITADIGLRWLGWVRFDFHSVVSLLDVLTARPDATVAAIRHIQVSSRPLVLSFSEFETYYGIVWVLKKLPKLQLHTLTILGGYTPGFTEEPAQADYNAIKRIIQFGAGWKELRYISPDSSLLSFPTYEKNGVTSIREPQPQTWRAQLTHRDTLGASVEIWRSKTNTAGAILKGHELERFEPSFAPKDLENFGQEPDAELSKPGEKDKEVLVVIKRGKTADITKHLDLGRYIEGNDLRTLRLTWPEIRRRFTGRRGGDIPLGISSDGYNLGAMDRRWSKVLQEL